MGALGRSELRVVSMSPCFRGAGGECSTVGTGVAEF